MELIIFNFLYFEHNKINHFIKFLFILFIWLKVIHLKICCNCYFLYSCMMADKKIRSVAKTFSWRLVGSINTLLLAWLVTGNSLLGIKLGIVEVLSKIILYYIHEKQWYKINFGLDKRKS